MRLLGEQHTRDGLPSCGPRWEPRILAGGLLTPAAGPEREGHKCCAMVSPNGHDPLDRRSSGGAFPIPIGRLSVPTRDPPPPYRIEQQASIGTEGRRRRVHPTPA